MPSYSVDENYPARPEKKFKNFSLNEAIDVSQNRPVWRLMFGTTHF